MSKWYLDENDRDIYLKDDKDVRWDYNTKELVRILNDLETKLGDMEQEQIKEMQEHQEAMKLADKTIKDTEAQNKRVLEKLELIVSANQELEQKLAEKENELTILKLDYEFVSKEYDKLVDIGVSKFKQHNQDKISFCIEQLEKVKEFVKETSGIVGHEWRIDRFRVLEQIDNQIKQFQAIKGDGVV